MNILLVLTTVFGLIEWEVYVQGQSIYQCHNAYECALTNDSRPAIECYGYHSCSQAIKVELITDIIGTGHGAIACFGGSSCAETSLLSIEHRDTGTDYGYIYCGGSFSCAFIHLIYNDKGFIRCSGELSCTESTIVIDGFITCFGSRSCSKSNITATSTIFAYGHLTLQDAIINIHSGDSSGGIALYMYGYDAGNGAQLMCSGSCNVYCEGGGCNNFTFGCPYDSIYSDEYCNYTDVNDSSINANCSISIICESAERSDACPDGYIIPEISVLF